MTVAEALAAIPARRDAINDIDSHLSDIIRHVEHVLYDELRVGLPAEVSFDTEHGRFILSWARYSGKWQLVVGGEADEEVVDDTPLVGVNRGRRAEVFSADPATGMTPVDRLIIEVAESLVRFAQERSPQVEAAERLLRVLEQAGFTRAPA